MEEQSLPSPFPDRAPTVDERYRAANQALLEQQARRRATGRAPLDDAKRYRNSVARKFLKEEHWPECWELLGLETFPLPSEENISELAEDMRKELEAGVASDPYEGLVSHTGPDGEEQWMTREAYLDMMHDWTGDPNDPNRELRDPFDWLKHRHPRAHQQLLELERLPGHDSLDLYAMAVKSTRSRFHAYMRAVEAKGHNPDQAFASNTVIQKQVRENFRAVVVNTWESRRLEASMRDEQWPPPEQEDIMGAEDDDDTTGNA